MTNYYNSPPEYLVRQLNEADDDVEREIIKHNSDWFVEKELVDTISSPGATSPEAFVCSLKRFTVHSISEDLYKIHDALTR